MTQQLRLTLLANVSMLALILTSCAAPGVTSKARTPVSATHTASPPVATSPASGASGQNCGLPAVASHMGDLALSAPSVLYGFNADYMLPADLPDKPLTVTMQDGGAYVAGTQLDARAVVGSGAAFVVEFCNTSATRSYHLTAFGAKIVTLTSYTGTVNALNGCAYLYGRPNGVGGECASGFSPDVTLTFRFADAAQQASDTQTPGSAVTLAPGQHVTVSYSIPAPANDLVAAYQLGVAVDGQALSYPAALTTQSVVSTPITRRWAGDYCSTSQMQAQIPATIPPNTYYACPQA